MFLKTKAPPLLGIGDLSRSFAMLFRPFGFIVGPLQGKSSDPIHYKFFFLWESNLSPIGPSHCHL